MLAADKLKKQVMYIANWYKTTTEEASRLFYNQDIAVIIADVSLTFSLTYPGHVLFLLSTDHMAWVRG